MMFPWFRLRNLFLVLVWVSACFNFASFVFMLLTLLAWLLCVAVFLPVAILFLPVSRSDGFWVYCWGFPSCSSAYL
jgi:hypothetical protein